METFKYSGFDVPVDLAVMTGGGPESFKQTSDHHLHNLKKFAHLNESSKIFELGCGIGRDAMPLASIIQDGSYMGVDIIKNSIDWCCENVQTAFPSIKFQHLNIRDQIHNSAGLLRADQLPLPLADASVDLVFAFSVFTHLFEHDIRYYLSEINRIMMPGGVAYLTCFIYNPNVLSTARKTNLTPWDLKFDFPIYEGCRINDPAHPLGAIAFTLDKINDMIKDSGLNKVCDPLHGAWSGHYDDAVDGQDVMLLVKQ